MLTLEDPYFVEFSWSSYVFFEPLLSAERQSSLLYFFPTQKKMIKSYNHQKTIKTIKYLFLQELELNQLRNQGLIQLKEMIAQRILKAIKVQKRFILIT